MATRTISVAGGNWDSTSTWDEGVVPVAGDAVVARSSGSGNLTVNVPSACASAVFTNYAATLTMNSTLTTTSTVTFVPGMTIVGTAGTLICTGSATLTSGGKTLTCALTLQGSITYTLGDNWTVNGLLSLGSTTSTTTVNGNQITCAGGYRQSATSGIVQGTTKLVITGGTWDSNSTGSTTLNIDLAGNVTVSGAIVWNLSGPKTLTYLSGTITTTGSTLTASSTSTFNTAGVVWNNVTLTTTSTFTLSSAFTGSGTLTLSGVTFTGAGTVTWTGPVAFAGALTLTLNNTGGLTTTNTMTKPNANVTFVGSAGWTVGTLTTAALSASRTYTYTFGNTYTVTSQITNLGTTAAIRQAIVSGTPGSKVVLNLSAGGTSDLVFCDPTDIDSSGGTAIATIRGTITTSLNWNGSVAAAVTATQGKRAGGGGGRAA